MLIRRARKSDVDAVTGAVFMAEGELIPFLTGFEDERNARRVLREFVLASVANRYSLANILVAELDGKTVGAVLAFPADSQPELDLLILASVNARGYNLKDLFFEGEAGSYYLSTMGVDPLFRGRGIGAALLAAAEAEGAASGYARSSLLVARENTKAKALYERLGYETTMTVGIGGVDFYRMGKQLPSGSPQGGGVSS